MGDPNLPKFTLRSARQDEAQLIKAVIRAEQLNPMNLSWRHFTLAVDERDQLIGCVQIKQHNDGSYELASLVVLPAWRGQGVARALIEYLLASHPGELYLTCRSSLEPFYQKFGFRAVDLDEMTPYFRRIWRIFKVIKSLVRLPDRLSVMLKNG
jgi:amino-acid N-acetyltransferase